MYVTQNSNGWLIIFWQTCSKFTEGMIGVSSSLLQLKQPPGIIHQILLMLRINSIHFPVFAAFIKQRTQEKLGKSEQKNFNSSQEHCTQMVIEKYEAWYLLKTTEYIICLMQNL